MTAFYMCPDCGKSFSDSMAYNGHRRKYTGEHRKSDDKTQPKETKKDAEIEETNETRENAITALCEKYTLNELREHYQEKFGKKPHYKANERKIAAEIYDSEIDGNV